MSVITRVYDDYASARSAKTTLDGLDMPGVEVSILGNESIRQHHEADVLNGSMTRSSETVVLDRETSGTATGAGVGAALGGGAGLLAGLGLLAIPGVGPLVAAGWLATAAVGAAGGAVAGGAVGAVVDLGLSEDEAPVFSEAMRRGSVAVSVQFPENVRSDVEGALNTVRTTSLSDRRTSYERDGWRI